MSSLSLSDFELRRVPKNRAHLPRTSSGSRSIMPSSSRMYCELTFRVSSMFRNLHRWKSPIWSRWRRSFSIPWACLSRNLFLASLQTLWTRVFSRRTALISCLSWVSALCRFQLRETTKIICSLTVCTEYSEVGFRSGILPVELHAAVRTRFSLNMEMSRLTRDGTAKPVSRDQILRHERAQGNIHFPSADRVQDLQPYPVVSRDQILRHERAQGNIHFPSADRVQDLQPYPVDP